MDRNVKTIVIEHPYSDYDFYHCLFVPSRVPKLLEAEGTCFAIEHLIHENSETISQDLNIVEFMSGKGEFEEHIRSSARFPIGKYVGIDSVSQSNPRTKLIVGDVTKKFPEFKANIILALYYSASSVLGPDGIPSPATMRSMCKNAFENLLPGGGFFLSFAAQGEALSFDLSDGEDDEEKEVPIPIYNGLRKKFDLNNTESAYLSFQQDNVYKRQHGVVVETMKKIKVINESKKIVGKIKINQPLYQLYMSESHIIDNLKQAGFTKFLFFDISYDEGHVTIEKLTNVMTESDEFATHIFAIKE